jgi:hypothetical protein
MTPLSYQGFGFTAILVMVGILSVAHLLKYLKERFYHRHENTKAQSLTLNAKPSTVITVNGHQNKLPTLIKKQSRCNAIGK